MSDEIVYLCEDEPSYFGSTATGFRQRKDNLRTGWWTIWFPVTQRFCVNYYNPKIGRPFTGIYWFWTRDATEAWKYCLTEVPA